MTKTIAFMTLTGAIFLTSCVSKKKYVALEQQFQDTKKVLQKTAVEKEDLENKFAIIEARVANYNAKINSLTEANNNKLVTVENAAVISENVKKGMEASLSKADPEALSQAKSLKDSMNIALTQNLKSSLDDSIDSNESGISVDIENTVVMISISDKMLFNSGSFRVSNKADGILQKLAEVINSEPSLEVMVEGHTDSKTINTPIIEDNWDLSVKRATSIIRKLVNKYDVEPAKLIAAGRSSYKPLVANDSEENMSINRRTRIVLLPNIDKFFALLTAN